MPFALDSSPEPSEISEAINYLLANFGANIAADPVTGQITGPTGTVIAYLYKYLAVKYADSADGSLNFSDSPTSRLYYGVRNTNDFVESTNPADYIWTKVAGGFGTTKFLWYQTSGGRQIQFVVDVASPALGYVVAPTSSIDLDVITSTSATPAFLAYFQPAAMQVIRTGSPLTPVFTGVTPRLYATANGTMTTFVTSQNDSDPAFGNNTWRIGNSPTTGYGDITYNQLTIGTPTNGGGFALWPAPTAMSGTPASLTVPVRYKSASGIITQASPAIVQLVFVDQGQDGSLIAYPSVYQWALSTPTISGTSTYTWSSSTFTPNPSGWSSTPGTGPAGYTLYRAQVTLTAPAGTTTSTINWTTASIIGIGYAASNGASSRICYSRIAGNPTPVSGTIYTSGSSSFPSSTQSATTWGITTTWGAVDPNPSSTDSLYQSDGIYDPTTNQTSWTTPYISSLKVGSLSAVSTNTGSLSVTGTFQASTAAISGTTMTGSGGVLYPSGSFAFGNTTSNIVFNGTTLNLNGLATSSNANYTGSTDITTYTSSSSPYNVLTFTKKNATTGLLTLSSSYRMYTTYTGANSVFITIYLKLTGNNGWISIVGLREIIAPLGPTAASGKYYTAPVNFTFQFNTNDFGSGAAAATSIQAGVFYSASLYDSAGTLLTSSPTAWQFLMMDSNNSFYQPYLGS